MPRMFKAFVLAMLAISCVAALPTGADLAQYLGVTGGNMATCILKRKVSAVTKAAATAWKGVKSMFGRKLGYIAAAVGATKGVAKAAATKACNVAGNAVVQKAGKASAGKMWGTDSQACAKELVAASCTTKVNDVFERKLAACVTGAAKASLVDECPDSPPSAYEECREEIKNMPDCRRRLASVFPLN